MNSSRSRKIFLTFDVEDFINERSVKALHTILLLLEKHRLGALFFITDRMAEKLALHKEVMVLLHDHQIGYHSSSHSVRPTIPEYTDVEDYQQAKAESMRRESSRIDPLTGEVLGEGGIRTLRDVFGGRVLEAHRAPDYCWSPAHLEALRDMGFQYDFSSKIADDPVDFRGITFYPFPIWHNWTGNYLFRDFWLSLLSRKTVVVNFHDWHFVDAKPWNYFYVNGNPMDYCKVGARRPWETRRMFIAFEMFLRNLRLIQSGGFARITPRLERSQINLAAGSVDVGEVYSAVARLYKDIYDYQPAYLCQHFERFFADSS